MTYRGQLKKMKQIFFQSYLPLYPKVSIKAMESANSLDTAFSALCIFVFLPINNFLGGCFFDFCCNDYSAWWQEEQLIDALTKWDCEFALWL